MKFHAAATSVIVLAGLLTPLTAHAAPGTATLRVTLGKGCRSKVVGPGLKQRLTSSTTLKGLRPGTYTITSKCSPKKRVKLKKGQRKKVRITKARYVNPRKVPTTITGTFQGSNVASPQSTQDTTWQGTVTLTRTQEVLSDSINFPYSSHYKVTAISGTVKPLPVEPNPTLCYDQNGSRPISINDVDGGDSGDSYPGAVFDPWAWAGHGTIYNIYVASTTDGWEEVGTQTCPISGGAQPPEIEPYSLAIPVELLLTDGWSGLPSNSQPVSVDGRFQGTYAYERPGSTTTWSWDLQGSDYITVDGPKSVPGSYLTPLVP